MWEAIQHVTSGLTLVAFLAAVVAWIAKTRSDERERMIANATDDRKAELVLRTLDEFFHVDTKDLTNKQKYDLAIEQIHARSKRFGTLATVVCVIAVLLAGVATYAISRTEDETRSKVEAKDDGARTREIGSNGTTVSLSAPTTWDFGNEVVRLRGAVLTNGHPLTVRAKKLVSENAEIRGRVDAAPAANGASGGNGNPGLTGQDGTVGGNGLDGQPGASMGQLAIETNEFTGRLRVFLSGQSAGDGGAGGTGGDGGNGIRGEASRPGPIDCASGPGHGGDGGNGAKGGNGGTGGAGGAGAAVSFVARSSFEGSIQIVAKGGAGGVGGSPGAGGRPGAGGPEGEARGLCRSAGRDGKPGSRGTDGDPGRNGVPGSNGLIDIALPKLTTQSQGEYAYSSQ